PRLAQVRPTNTAGIGSPRCHLLHRVEAADVRDVPVPPGEEVGANRAHAAASRSRQISRLKHEDMKHEEQAGLPLMFHVFMFSRFALNARAPAPPKSFPTRAASPAPLTDSSL